MFEAWQLFYVLMLIIGIKLVICDNEVVDGQHGIMNDEKQLSVLGFFYGIQFINYTMIGLVVMLMMLVGASIYFYKNCKTANVVHHDMQQMYGSF